MANDGQTRTRSQRVAALDLPPNRIARAATRLRQRDVLTRIGICVLASVAAWSLTRGWEPAFVWREGISPSFDVVARVKFVEPARDLVEPDSPHDVGTRLADEGIALSPETLNLLSLEHDAYLATKPSSARILRSVAFLGVCLSLCGAVSYYL